MVPVPASSTVLPTTAPSPTQAAQAEDGAQTSPSSTLSPEPTISATLLEQLRAEFRKEHPEESWDLIVPRYNHDAVLLDDGRVLLGGGYTGVANNNVIVPLPIGFVELYDVELDVWSPIDPVDGPGHLYSLVMLADGRVLAVGVEASEDDADSMAAVFDPTTDKWGELPGSPDLIRALPDAFLLHDGRILVAGGLDLFSDPSAFSPDYVEEFEIFDPATGEWQRAASPPKPFQPEIGMVQPFFVQLADGRVVALGTEGSDEFSAVPRVEMYDPSTDTWTTVDGVDEYYGFRSAVALVDGRLLVHGQFREFSVLGTSHDSEGNMQNVILRDGTELNANEFVERFPVFKIYDPDADTWTPVGEPVYSRPNATLALLPDGRVLAAGGEDGWTESEESGYYRNRRLHTSGARLDLSHSTTEIFDPETNSWSLGPDLSELRLGSTATVLRDGRVLLTGGIGMALDIEEIYPLPSSEAVDPDGPPGTRPR